MFGYRSPFFRQPTRPSTFRELRASRAAANLLTCSSRNSRLWGWISGTLFRMTKCLAPSPSGSDFQLVGGSNGKCCSWKIILWAPKDHDMLKPSKCLLLFPRVIGAVFFLRIQVTTSKQRQWLTSATSIFFCSEKKLRNAGIKLWAAGSGSEYVNHCAVVAFMCDGTFISLACDLQTWNRFKLAAIFENVLRVQKTSLWWWEQKDCKRSENAIVPLISIKLLCWYAWQLSQYFLQLATNSSLT